MIDVQWAFISVFTTSLVNVILRIVLGREFGPEGLGVYTLAFTIFLFGMQFSAFGISAALTQYVAQSIDDHAAIKKYVSSGMTSSIITGSLMGGALFLLAPYIAISFFKVPELENYLKLIALCFPFIAIQKAVLGTLNGFRRMHLYAFLNIVEYVSVVGVSLVFVLVFGMGVRGAIIGLAASTILIGILCPALIKGHIGLDNSLWDTFALRATTVFGFYVVLANSISYLNTQVDSILIGHYLNPTEVGIYAVAALIVQVLPLIPSAVQCVTTPAMATLYGKGDMEGVRHIFYSTLKKSFFLSAGSAVLLAIFSPYFIIILFGEKFLGSYVPLLILLIGYAISATYSAVGSVLSSIGKVHIMFRIGGVSVLINIALNILLIPYFGISGAAIATTIALIANFGIAMMIINNYLNPVNKRSNDNKNNV